MNDRKGLALGSATVILVATALTAATSDAHAAGPVVSGNGWKLRPGVTHIDSKPWVIAFNDTTSRTKLTTYAKNNAAELTARLGVTFTVTTKIIHTSTSKCLPSHTISYRWQSKPDPNYPTRSYTTPCTFNSAPHSASIYINSDYWKPGSRILEHQRLNVFWHETAHAAGLTHPATCPTDRYGRKPLMCDVNSYKSLNTSRRYSSFEATAFRYLVANRAYYPLTAVTR